MTPNLQRAQLLYEQSRYDLAETELRQALANEPHNSYAHSLLALCLVERKRFQEATEEAQQAIHLAPDVSFSHYALARVMSDRNRFSEAIVAINEAIRLDSTDADYFALLAGIHFQERRWRDALFAAEAGLQFDPDHVACTNLHAMALVKLGRKAEAGATIATALAKNPDNALTHANQGWTLLEKGEPKKALEHFREALRLDPENEWARHGIVEALKARNIIYALMLKYFLWMSKLSKQAQWFIILGGFFGNRALASLAASHPGIAPWVLPFRILYITFALLTWLAYPMFNLMLRLNSFGRLVLTPPQNIEANFLGWLFVLTLGSLAGCITEGFESPWLLSMAVPGLLMLPVAGAFRCASGWPRNLMTGLAITLALIGCGAVAVMWSAYQGGGQFIQAKGDMAFGIFSLFCLGIFASSILVNVLGSVIPRR